MINTCTVRASLNGMRVKLHQMRFTLWELSVYNKPSLKLYARGAALAKKIIKLERVRKSMKQLSIDLGKKLKEEGMKASVDHANSVYKEWSEVAYDFLKGYIKINPMFMTEDVRFASQGIVPSPPSQRAWGSIIRRAAVEGLIHRSGYKQVKNWKAHHANASVWKSLIVKNH